ncbi:MAG: CapA family protein [Parvularculaceae bacterium]
MTLGRVYHWEPDEAEFSGGVLRLKTVPLRWLDRAEGRGDKRLRGRFVQVASAAALNDGVAIGDAQPDAGGDFLFAPAAGGGRRAKKGARPFLDEEAMTSANRFGEVNAYHHITLIAERIDAVLASLGAKPLPPVRAVVNARGPQRRGEERAAPLKSSRYAPGARGAGAPGETRYCGEIQLTEGFSLAKDGWLARLAGERYRCGGAHVAPTLYRLYACHLARWTADFAANDFVRPGKEDPVRTATTIAVGEYWSAAMLETPHPRCWRERCDDRSAHPLNLAGSTVLTDLAPDAGPATRANVLASALWDLRREFDRVGGEAGRQTCDRLVVAGLLAAGRLQDDPYRPDVDKTRALRDGFSVFAACLIHADAVWFNGACAARIRDAMRRRGIPVSTDTLARLRAPRAPVEAVRGVGPEDLREHAAKIRERFPDAVFPTNTELLSPDDLEAGLHRRSASYDLAVVGDVMTGMRLRHRIRRHGPSHTFAWTKPIFERTAVVLGNQEGPFASGASLEETTRNFAYKVDPASAAVVRRGGLNVMTLANNHITDCGRGGVVETIAALDRQGVATIGGGLDETSAHDAAIFETRGGRVGLLGYYWNRRTAATWDAAGSARDLPELVERDIARLRDRVDRIAVTVHWGVPYEREPAEEDRQKARHFIDCGADIVVGHHPHIIQPFEVYRDRPIFYSVGNFAFGSGNSRAESLLVAARFLREGIEVDVYPVYVQNRDPRLDYQPKVMRGEAARTTLMRLAAMSGPHGAELRLREHFATLRTAAKWRRRGTAFDQLRAPAAAAAGFARRDDPITAR